MWLHQRVHVIRHDDEGAERIALTIEVTEGGFDRPGAGRLSEKTGAATCIKIAIEPDERVGVVESTKLGESFKDRGWERVGEATTALLEHLPIATPPARSAPHD